MGYGESVLTLARRKSSPRQFLLSAVADTERRAADVRFTNNGLVGVFLGVALIGIGLLVIVR
jgi:hypothetical protein